MSKLLLCCTKNKRGYLHFDKREDTPKNRKYYLSPDSSPFDTYEPDNYLNGKVFAECDYEVEEIENNVNAFGDYKLPYFETKTLNGNEIEERSRLSYGELKGRLQNGGNGFYGYSGYAIHIKNLNTFDNARSLNYYWNKNKKECLKHSPSNMMKVSEIKQEEITIPFKTNPKEVNAIKINDYILVMVNPEEACDLLNGNRTLLIRKRVIKGMLVNE